MKHWDARLEVMDGKAMIVCMSRRICYELRQVTEDRPLSPEEFGELAKRMVAAKDVGEAGRLQEEIDGDYVNFDCICEQTN